MSCRPPRLFGLDLFYETTVDDNLGRLVATLRQGVSRSDVIVTTGGIEPTADDITREAVAEATERKLVFSSELMAQIETYFAPRGFRLSPSNRRHGYIPAGAILIEYPVGTPRHLSSTLLLDLVRSAVSPMPMVPKG